MYGSYGSYSSMCAVQMSAPIDITTGFAMTRQDASCAFPSWPRGSSLSGSERASSYLSDEDLFPLEDLEDDARSVSSSSSGSSNSGSCPLVSASPPRYTEADLLEMQQARQARQREMLRVLMSEKERRKQAALAAGRRPRRSSSKKSPPTKKLAAISEMGGE